MAASFVWILSTVLLLVSDCSTVQATVPFRRSLREEINVNKKLFEDDPIFGLVIVPALFYSKGGHQTAQGARNDDQWIDDGKLEFLISVSDYARFEKNA